MDMLSGFYRSAIRLGRFNHRAQPSFNKKTAAVPGGVKRPGGIALRETAAVPEGFEATGTDRATGVNEEFILASRPLL